jgi:exodeoxyribonuclease VII large subunit
MSDESPTNATEFSVFELSVSLKRVVEDAFGYVRVRGEISGFRGVHSSGHAYFALKDDRARLEAVIWRGSFSKLKFQPEEGMEVIATGKLTTFPGSSKYQIVIEQMEPAGAGALMALLDERKRRLAAEGLFDEGRKQLLPYLPRVIGVVTSPTGAVIRDIIHRISDRFPVHVLVWPVRVQGDGSGGEVAAAVTGFNVFEGANRPDVIIVARGGGSLEDLWGFNDEAVVRAVAASDIPVISAVGHETDWTLIDFAADVRAPTPTGAAEMAVPVRADLVAHLATVAARLSGGLSREFERKRRAVRAAARALPGIDMVLALPRRRFDEAVSRLGRSLIGNIERKRIRFAEGAPGRLTPELLSRSITERRTRIAQAGERLERANGVSFARRADRFARSVSAFSLRPIERRLKADRDKLDAVWRLAGSFSYKKTLERGFALVQGSDGKPVKRRAEVQAGDALEIRFADGEVNVREQSGAAPAKSKTKPAAVSQGDLF